MSLFPNGQVVATPAALKFMADHNINPVQLLARHVGGDFGDLDLEDVRSNINAIQHDLRVFSSYKFGDEKIWCITEADRSSTCFLMPSEY